MYFNKNNEEIIYQKYSGYSPFFDIMMAGITNKNPDYYNHYNHRIQTFHNYHVFEYVLSGKGHIEYEGQHYTVEAGDFYYYHRESDIIYYADAEDPYKKIWINMSGELLDRLIEVYRLGKFLIRRIDCSDIIREMHLLIAKLDPAYDPNVMRAISKLAYTLIETVSDSDLLFGIPTDTSTAVRIRDYINNHLTSRLTLPEIAEKFYISETHCIRLFRSEFGTTPMKYMLNTRLDESRRLLAVTMLPVQEIALMFNFSDHQHYCKAFKCRFGVSPTEYRRLCGQTGPEEI